MALFKRKADIPEPVAVEETPEEVLVGPKDSDGQGPPKGYVDLGSLYVPPVPGMQVRAQFEADGKTLHRIQLILGSSGMRVFVAAAPRSGGVWPELREQLAASVVKQGGTAEEVAGRYGTELHAKLPVRLANGEEGQTPVRFLGLEGPRWIVRVDIQGAAATGDEAQEKLCHFVIDNLIVNRGNEPRVRLSLLPLTIPKETVQVDK